MSDSFTEEQQKYLEGFAVGSGLTRSLPTFAGTLGLTATDLPGGGKPPRESAPGTPSGGPEAIHYAAQDAQVAAGRKLCPEEVAKRKTFPLNQWDDVVRHAAKNEPPKGTDVLAFKYQGLFWVAPAQESFMCRLRFAGGIMTSAQLRGVSDLAHTYGGGFADVTTRANLQIRQIKPADTVHVIEHLHDLGILCRGSGADNIRNVTGSATAGIDPDELIDTRPLTRATHHHILNHRELYGLPRKFNIAYDGGGAIHTLEDTNDIGYSAVRIGPNAATRHAIEPGVYFRLTLGGITGHKDFARDTGVLLKPEECVPVAHAILLAFIEHGDRTDRKKARLKYVLDRMGFDGFLAEVEKRLPEATARLATPIAAPLRRVPSDAADPRPAVAKHGHIGFFPQKQAGKTYVGVVLPVGRMTCDQMRGLAKIADRFASGTIRLTVWQNLLISDLDAGDADVVASEIDALGLGTTATNVRGGLVACTGNAGCKFAMANTKRHAMAIAEYCDEVLHEGGHDLDVPVNIHVTGCPNSCAQHYIGDIGLLGTKVPDPAGGEDAERVEGYHLFVGGGYGDDQAIGRQLYTDVPADQTPFVVERMLRGYLTNRTGPNESFNAYVRRYDTDQLLRHFDCLEVVR